VSLSQLAVNRGLVAEFSETHRAAGDQGFLTS